MKLYKQNIDEDKSDIKLTEQRKDYEIYRAAENHKDLVELKKFEKKEELQSLSVSTLLGKLLFLIDLLIYVKY